MSVHHHQPQSPTATTVSMGTTATGRRRKPKALLRGLEGSGFLDKATEDLVAVTRLKAIEREHKSYGSYIDDRQLFPIVDVTTPRIRKKHVGDDSTAASVAAKPAAAVPVTAKGGAAGSAVAAVGAGSSAAAGGVATSGSAAALMKGDDQSVVSNLSAVAAANYDNEELIWRTKAQDKLYFQKRVFEEPDLQHFYESLNVQQKSKFRKLCVESLHGLADGFRADMAKVKEEMDADGIFHPSANAHRVHCMYLMKLYKGISAATIENPVLRKMRADMATKKAQKAAQEAEKARLIRMAEMVEAGMEEGDGEAEREAAAAALAAAANAAPPSADPRLSPVHASRQGPGRGGAHSRGRHASPSQSTAGPPGGKGGKARNGVGDGSGAGKGAVAASSSSVTAKSGKKGVVKEPSTSNLTGKNTSTSMKSEKADKSTAAAAAADGKEKDKDKEARDDDKPSVPTTMSHQDKMLFNRMRQRKLGAVDAELLLQEEAEKLQEADVVQPKKLKFRSSLLDSKAATWMLEKLQMSRLAHGDSLASEEEDEEVQKNIVPYAEFQRMFAEFQEKNDALGLHPSVVSAATGTGTGPGDARSPPAKGKGSRASLSRTSSRSGSLFFGPGGLLGTTQPPPPPERRDPNSLTGSDALGIVVDSGFDAVGYLANEDPLLATFLAVKAAAKDKPAARRLARGAAAALKPKSKRLYGQVGLGAVTLAPLTAPPGAPAPAAAAGPGQTFLRTSKPLPRTLRGQDGHASGFFNIFQTAGPEPDSTDILPTGVEMPDDAAGAAAAAADRRKAAESRESTPEGSMALSGSGAGGGGGGGVGRGGMLADDGEDSLAPLRAPPTGTGTGTTPAGSPSRGLSRTRSMKNAYGTGSVKLTARSTHGGGGGGVADDSYEGDGETPPTQLKLQAMWECLRFPASERLEFMRKYSLPPFSQRLGTAVDLWCEAAVLVKARAELTTTSAAVEDGTYRLPLRVRDLVERLRDALPPELLSYSPVFLPLAQHPSSDALKRSRDVSDFDPQQARLIASEWEEPLSAAMFTTVENYIRAAFARAIHADRLGAEEEPEAPADADAPLLPTLPALSANKRSSVGGLSSSSRQLLIAGSVAVNAAISRKRSVRRASRASVPTLLPWSPSGQGPPTVTALADAFAEPFSPLSPGAHSVKFTPRDASAPRYSMFLKFVEKDGMSLRDAAKAQACLDDLIRVVDQLLMAALTKTHTEIDDHVTYMRRPVKVWLSEMWDEKARKDNPPPEEGGEGEGAAAAAAEGEAKK